ncbi:MAG: hypothetical protein ACPL3E_00145 [Minisyncoccia bacterium]
MQELIHQLGIDWKLLLSQAVNFGLVLIILKIFVYQPLLNLLNERRKKIEEGILKAEEADKRLSQVENLKLEKIKEAEKEVLTLIQEGKEKAIQIEAEILEKAKQKQEEILKQAELMARDQAKKAEAEVYKKAKELVKTTIQKTVELDPRLIDESLINQALESLNNK